MNGKALEIIWKSLLWIGLTLISYLSACRSEMPVLSSITVQADGWSIPVDPSLYGLTIEEINHGVEGGLYGELIRNRSFEEGVPPLNCPYDAVRNVLITPNGWTIPFVRRDSIPGWHCISPYTQMWADGQELLNDKNRRSLLVSVSASSETGRGGIAAEGYRGIALRKGQRYELSFFAKGTSMIPKSIRVALEDTEATTVLSDVFTAVPTYEWQRYQHTFTATADREDAILTITADSSVVFWLDVVSLFPQETWKKRTNGLRPDLAALIDSLAPAFIRFPGGSFVEGYTAGTFPIWRETVGDISQRKHFWNVWGYGSTNGMGYHEYLQLCEDLGAEPVYVVNSGVTSQSRRPRYEDITAMDKLVGDALDAIAYANAPVDSTLGALRASQGHPEPFHLKYIEIGSENYGTEYSRRFVLFQKAIREAYPDITVISSSPITRRVRSEWVDTHYHTLERFLLASSDRFDNERFTRRTPAVFIGEFGTTDPSIAGSLRAAVAEACFLIGTESHPDVVRRLAYAPVLGNAGFECQRFPMITFNTHQAVVSPSYYLFQLFARHRGDEVLQTEVNTFEKPQAYTGRAGIELFDNSFDFQDVRIDNQPVAEINVLSGGWKVESAGTLVPVPNRWNHVLFGDSTRYAYDYSVKIRRTKGSGQIQLRLRDNGLTGEQADYICMTIGLGTSELYHQAGGVKDPLVSPVSFPFESKRWYDVRLTCENERIRCYVDGTLLHEVSLRPIPSLVSLATWDKAHDEIYIKVVNTTWHDEKTALHIEGIPFREEVKVIQLKGDPDSRNTFEHPDAIVPTTERIYLTGDPLIYHFPPQSITILKLKVN